MQKTPCQFCWELKFEQNLWSNFGLIDERMNHSDTEQPVFPQIELQYETSLWNIPFKYLWNQMNLLPTKSVNLEFHKLDHLYFSGRVFFPEVKFTFSHEFFNSTTSSSSSSPKSFYTSHTVRCFYGTDFEVCAFAFWASWEV